MLSRGVVCLLKSNLPAAVRSSCRLGHYLLPAPPDLLLSQGLTTSLEAPLGCEEGMGLVLWTRGQVSWESSAFRKATAPN